MTKPIRIGKPKAANQGSQPAALRETILLVDDEEAVREFLSKMLIGEGYRVIVAGNGEQALSMSEEFGATIHLLVTDVMMPVMNGKELADRLCTLRPEIKVLFISGYRRADFWTGDACEDQTDWLPKPFSGPLFQRRVRELLDSVNKL
ncbi:MAG: putative Histidine kinase [Fibrobacteres bacterium]|nr:putative Histidine kinase [Fibrobacterota bacterium]